MKFPKLPNGVYDVLKWLCVILLPALALFIPRIFNIWGIPLGDQIADTITATQFFIGALIGVSTIAYNKSQK